MGARREENKLMLPDDILESTLAFCDHLTRQRFGSSSPGNGACVRRSAGRKAALKEFCEGALLRAGAPPGLMVRLGVVDSLRHMRRYDLPSSSAAWGVEYIDFLTPRDFSVGCDHMGRFYLALSYVWRRGAGVACLFQRYKDNVTLFVNAYDALSEAVVSSSFFGELARIAPHHADLLTLVRCGTVVLEGGEEIFLA